VRFKAGLLLALLTACAVLAQESDQPFSELPASLADDTIFVNFPYSTYITPEDSSSLRAGEEIALICRLELWQDRKIWFDRLRITVTNYLRLSYDRWEQEFIVVYRDPEGWEARERSERLDTLLANIERQAAFALPLSDDDLGKQSYLACSVEIDYLSAEQLKEIADWLKGEEKDGGESKSFPGKVVGFLLKSSGLKNRSDLRASEKFRPDRLEGAIKF
jgi:hypothetical protein